MVRQEFIKLITNLGIAPIKDLKSLMLDRNPKTIGELGLADVERFDELKFAKETAQKKGLKYMDLSGAKVSSDLLNSIKKTDVIKYRMIPIQKSPSMIVLAIFDPTITEKKGEISKILNNNVDFIMTSISAWRKLYEDIGNTVDDLLTSVKFITGESAKDDRTSSMIRVEDIGDDIVHIVNKILLEAYTKKASDIHIEPYEKTFRIRIRIDGALIVHNTPPMKLMLPIISRVKILAQMDIAERRKPQDGRIKMKIGEETVDYRVSSLPTLFGEKVVLRLLDQSNLQLDMTKLGFETGQLDNFKEGILRPYGMCLVTGPTGSGKTTTLYSALSELNTPDTNISTAEDPVEFNLEGINQVNVRKDIGYTFASSLKSFLRQDPDVIMVGEIRDFETGEIAVEAALTGHLVLSTLHTNDSASTITRLLNMGIEPFLIVGALNVVVAQRLCRKICKGCREKVDVDRDFLVTCGFSPSSASKVITYKGLGCNLCNGTGHKGRVAIYEVLTVSLAIKNLILKNASAEDLKRAAIKEGMKTLRMSALTKVAMGLTTLEEAISNSSSDS